MNACGHIEHAVRPETGRVGRIDQFPYLRWEPCPDTRDEADLFIAAGGASQQQSPVTPTC